MSFVNAISLALVPSSLSTDIVGREVYPWPLLVKKTLLIEVASVSVENVPLSNIRTSLSLTLASSESCTSFVSILSPASEPEESVLSNIILSSALGGHAVFVLLVGKSETAWFILPAGIWKTTSGYSENVCVCELLVPPAPAAVKYNG